MGVIVAVVIGVAVLSGLAVMLAMTDRGLSDEPVDRLDAGLPDDGPVGADDISRLRFRIGLRGYRMDDVDAALERIRESMLAVEDPDHDRDAYPEADPDPDPDPDPGPVPADAVAED